MRHRYPSAKAPSDEPMDRLRAQTGTGFRHVWVRHDGGRRSTLDLFGGGYVLLAGPRAAGRWTPGVERGWPPASARLQTVGVDFEFAEDHDDWAALTGLSDDGALLVRPDGFVADRSDLQAGGMIRPLAILPGRHSFPHDPP